MAVVIGGAGYGRKMKVWGAGGGEGEEKVMDGRGPGLEMVMRRLTS